MHRIAGSDWTAYTVAFTQPILATGMRSVRSLRDSQADPELLAGVVIVNDRKRPICDSFKRPAQIVAWCLQISAKYYLSIG